MTEPLDVAILGGGPCGLAAAISLATAGRRVAVFERKRFGGPRVGETFAPPILSSLQSLGVADDFLALEKIPFRGVRSAWGSSECIDRPSIVHPLGDGFHVDRASFDALLARHAAARGALLHDDMGVASIESGSDGWHLRWSNGGPATARFIVDASGRGAPGMAKGLSDRHWVACDRAVAIVARLSPPAGRELQPELLIETAEDGWWYAVPQPGPALLCVLMTDSDLLGPAARDDSASWWHGAVGRTVHVRDLCAGSTLAESPRFIRADTGFLLPNRGPGWRAVGDAAFASDPLSGDGMLRGLASTIEAARTINEILDGASDGSVDDSGKAVQAYLDRRQQYYRIEKRWPATLFWKRRHGIDWQSAPIFLDPRTILGWNGAEPSVESIAPIEGLLPPRALRMALERLRKPCPAHDVLGALRAVVPMGDKRLLVALQELVAREIVSTNPPA